AGRQLRGIDLVDEEAAIALHLLEVDAEALQAREQKAELFVENEQRRLFATLDRSDDKDDCRKRLPGARGSPNQRAASGLNAATEELVELGEPAGHRRSHKVAAIFRRHQ